MVSVGEPTRSGRRLLRDPDALRPVKGFATALAMSIVLWAVIAYLFWL